MEETTMDVPLKGELLQALSGLGISLEADTSLDSDIHQCCRALRDHLLTLPSPEARVPLSGASFWDVTPVHRFDLIRRELIVIPDQLAYSIGFSSLYLPQLAPITRPYYARFAENLFWYHVDFGFRLASSGWDRIALLLDLAFDLGLETRCSLKTVLKELPGFSRAIEQNENFKALKQFRDTKLRELEGKSGRGVRHEATHMLSPSTRLAFEFFESCLPQAELLPAEVHPKGRRDMLIEHHALLASGTRHALELVQWRWPS
jgi:hypothetical protein